MNSHLHGQLINDKGGKNIQRGKDSLFDKHCWENWTATGKRIMLDYFTPYKKVNSKWIRDLNVTLETKTFSRRKHRHVFSDKHSSLTWVFAILFGYGSLGKGNKRKNRQMGLHQSKNLYTAEKIINKMKGCLLHRRYL